MANARTPTKSTGAGEQDGEEEEREEEQHEEEDRLACHR